MDSLTERELEILRYLADGLSDREIAQQLFLSLNTIKWHNRQIYSKLGVESRTQAVARSRELGLLNGQQIESVAVPDRPKHNLPAHITSFVGRERELEEVKSLLESTRLVTLTGPGGIGKTRLAQEAASQHLEAFADGVSFVPLAPLRSTDGVVPTMAESLGFSFSSPDNPKRQLLTFLREKQTLLVLDNFDQLLDGAPLLSDILQAAPNLKIIVTSREQLNLHGETVFNIQGLDFPGPEVPGDLLEYSSVDLFVQSAMRAKAGFAPGTDEVKHVAQICRLVQGMPLALELAATWVTTLTCQEIAAEIKHGHDILQVELRDLPERQRSIRAVFDYSWSLTPPEEREIYKKLAVFRGGFTRAAAEKVTGAALKSLSSLVSKSLIWHRSSGRYEMHELLRQYAEERLATTSGALEAVSDLHCAYFAEFLHQRRRDVQGESQLTAYKEIEEDVDNIRAGWNWAVAHGRFDDLAKQAPTLLLLFETRSWYQEGLDSFAKAVEATTRVSRSGKYRLAIGRLLDGQSHFATRLGEYDEALTLLKESEAVFRELDHRQELADTLTRLGAAEFYLGNYERADKVLRECLHICKEFEDPWPLAWTSFWSGRVNYALGRFEEAEQLLLSAITVHRQLGDRMPLTDALVVLGWTTHKLGKYEDAIRLENEALSTATEFGSPHRIAWALLSLGKLETAQGDFQDARLHLHEALQGAIEIMSVRLQLDALVGIGELLVREGDTERAREILSLISRHASSEHETRRQAEELLGELGVKRGSELLESDADDVAKALANSIESVYVLPAFSQLRPG